MFNPEYENLPSFKRFVERQPASKGYPYPNSWGCACAQFLQDEGRFNDSWLTDPKMKPLNDLARGDDTLKGGPEWTFGQLLARINAKEKELA